MSNIKLFHMFKQYKQIYFNIDNVCNTSYYPLTVRRLIFLILITPLLNVCTHYIHWFSLSFCLFILISFYFNP